MLRGVAENIADDMHRRSRGIDVRIAHHELLEDIVLNGTGELLLLYAGFLGRYDVERQDRQHGTVHGHRHGHLVQRNAVEEHLHVLYRADGHAGLTHVAYHTGVVGIITAVRSQVESHRQTFLSGSQVAAVEGVGFGRRRETGVLTHRPGAHHIHGGVRSAKIRSDTGYEVQLLVVLDVIFGEARLDLDVLGRFPRLDGGHFARARSHVLDLEIFCFYFRKIGFHFAFLCFFDSCV